VRLPDLARPLPVVTRQTSALDAARCIARDRLNGLVVADETGRPRWVVSAIGVLGLFIPRYIADDIRLAGVLDEAGADELWKAAAERTIAEVLDDKDVHVYDIHTVDPKATLIEAVALLATGGTPILLLDDEGSPPQFLTLATVLDAALTASGLHDDLDS
jgi:CBS domain-containing protein